MQLVIVISEMMKLMKNFAKNNEIKIIHDYFKPIKRLTKPAIQKFFKQFPLIKLHCEEVFKQFPEMESIR